MRSACGARVFSREALNRAQGGVQDDLPFGEKYVTSDRRRCARPSKTDEGRTLLAFLEADSERGILK